jgi:16S rRNA (cytidine1402-2'-O)-methyltransferase
MQSKSEASPAGALYIVGTPIGNLRDLTLRAIDTLRAADRIYAEDTRRTRALLAHLEIFGKPLARFDAHVENQQLQELVERVESGQRVALVSDAGMPLISDPGAPLVRALALRNLRIEVIPGPSAVTAAVALSGLVSGPFLFLGFLPRQGARRRAALQRIAQSSEPVIVFESANRAKGTLAQLAERSPQRQAAVCRELTKQHEEACRGSLTELSEIEYWRGELTIVIGERARDSVSDPASTAERPDEAAIEARIRSSLLAGQTSKQIAIDLVSWCGLPRRDAYARVQAVRNRADESRSDTE